ncbi:MAG: FMN-binding protein [Microbacteriaceae bacterium]|nr:FMN-binding protein [Microbacteriaceae bacterium]
MPTPAAFSAPRARLPRAAALPLLGLTLIGGLAGCASTPAPAEPGTGSSAPEPPAAESPTAPEAPAGSAFADGTYTADGDYFAPSGPESVTVTVTLADGAVADVQVVGHATDPQAKQHQAEFVGGIAAAVVGKPIEGLAVDRVAGSSLTGQGFNAALDDIRAQAQG